MREDVSISQRFHFLSTPGRLFFKFDMGKVVEVYYYCGWWESNPDPKTHGLSTTPFVKVLEGYFSPFDHLQRVNLQLTT